MKKIIIILSAAALLISCKPKVQVNLGEQNVIENSPGIEQTSLQHVADSLLYYMNKASRTDTVNRLKWEQKFFYSFPNSFKQMQAIFGFDKTNGATPLYSKGEEIINYFGNLRSISDSIYYDKYVKINIGGVWEADNIQRGFGFDRKLLDNTEKASQALSWFTDSEIKSVFYFIFDGPHPQNNRNKELYEKIKSRISNQNEKLTPLLNEAYENLIADSKNRAH